MFITIETKTISVQNPYWTPQCSSIESEYVDETREFITIHESREALRDFLAKRGSFTGNMRHFAAEEIYPKIKTTVGLDL